MHRVTSEKIYRKALRLEKKKKVGRGVLEATKNLYLGINKARKRELAKQVMWSELIRAEKGVGKAKMTARLVRLLEKKIRDKGYSYFQTSGFKGYAVDYQINNDDLLMGNLGLLLFYSLSKPLKQYLQKHKGLKVSFVAKAWGKPNSKLDNQIFYIQHPLQVCLTDADVDTALQGAVSGTKVRIEEAELKGSGWKFQFLDSVFANILPGCRSRREFRMHS